MEIDEMVSMHFLDDTKYSQMYNLMTNTDNNPATNAYELVREELTGYLDLVFTADATNICNTGNVAGDYTCVMRTEINRRQVVHDYAVHPLHTGMGTNNRQEDSNWLQEHVLGFSDFANKTATDFTNIIRDKHAINDRYNKAWFVNPMYKWTVEGSPQAILSLSEKTIIVAIVSLEDKDLPYGSAGSRRRFLLQASPDGQTTFELLSRNGQTGQFPPIVNRAVNKYHATAKLAGVANEQHMWHSMHADVKFAAPKGKDMAWVRNEIQTRLNAKLPTYSKNVQKVNVVQFLMQPSSQPIPTSRALLTNHDDVVDWDGFIEVVFSTQQIQSEQMHIYYNWMRCALFLGNITTDREGSPTPDCGIIEGSGALKDQIDSIWSNDVCGNATTSYITEGCTDIANLMWGVGSSVPVNTPPR